jgi:hypothetical protein
MNWNAVIAKVSVTTSVVPAAPMSAIGRALNRSASNSGYVIEGKPAKPVRQPIAPTHHTARPRWRSSRPDPPVGQPIAGYAVSEVSCAPVATPA